MFFFQLTIALTAIYLFLLFIAQPFIFAGRMLSRLISPPDGPFTTYEDPNAVEVSPLYDLSEVPFIMELGRDRRGRMIYKAPDDAGGHRFYYRQQQPEEVRYFTLDEYLARREAMGRATE